MQVIKIRLQKSKNGPKLRSPQNMAWVGEKYWTAKFCEWGAVSCLLHVLWWYEYPVRIPDTLHNIEKMGFSQKWHCGICQATDRLHLSFSRRLVWPLARLRDATAQDATARHCTTNSKHTNTQIQNTNTKIHYLATCLFEICDCSRHKWTPVNTALWNILCTLFNNVQCVARIVHCALCIV